MSPIPTEAVDATRPTGGVDWAKDDHAVCGRRPRRRADPRGSRSPTTRPGCAPWSGGCWPAGVAEVGIERPDGPVVDALRAGRADRATSSHPASSRTCVALRLGRQQGRPVRRLRAGRRRAHRPAPAAPAAGRHPRHHRAAPDRARPPRPGRPPGRGGQPAARAPADRAFPARSGCSPTSTPTISLRFLERFPTQDRADWLSPKRLGAWLASVGYSGRTLPDTLHTRLTAAPRGATGPAADTAAAVTAAFVAVLRTLTTQIEALAARIASNSTCTPTPRSSPACPAPGACAPPGCSPRSATPAAGSPPPTRWPAWPGSPPPPASPARSSVVCFRWGADKQLRDALCDFAGDSRHANPWAADLYQPSPRPRTRPPPRRPHPGPRLGRHHLGLLDHQHPLRPRPPRRAPTHPQPRSTEGGLTQGNSSHSLAALGRTLREAL